MSAFRKHTINIDGIQKSLHGVNTEGVHLTLSPNLGTELRGIFREGSVQTRKPFITDTRYQFGYRISGSKFEQRIVNRMSKFLIGFNRLVPIMFRLIRIGADLSRECHTS